MNKLALVLISIFMIALMACSSTTNPLSSEVEEENGNNYNDSILFDTSGHPDNG